jgi:hypothetical protein
LEVSTNPSVNLINLLEYLIELRHYSICIYPLITKDILKDTNEQQMRRSTELQKGPEHSSFCPYRAGMYHPPSTWVYSDSPTQKLSEPCLFQVLWRLHYVDMIECIFGHCVIHSAFSLSRPWRLRGGTESSNPTVAWFVPPATRPHPVVIQESGKPTSVI